MYNIIIYNNAIYNVIIHNIYIFIRKKLLFGEHNISRDSKENKRRRNYKNMRCKKLVLNVYAIKLLCT